MYKLIILLCFAPKILFADVELRNKQQLKSQLGLSGELMNEQYYYQLNNLKIAVLDNGFEGRSGIAERLGSKLHVVKEYPKEFLEKYDLSPQKRANRMARTTHGSGMAMIVEGLLENSRASMPDIYLLNSNGITNFRRAVFYALDKDVDLILYAQNWEFGGNYDGAGFINQIVSEISSYKAIWVNAAGNYGSMVWNGSYLNSREGLINHDRGDSLNFEVKFDATPVTITVAWNDFKDYEQYQTDKDIDVEVRKSGIKQLFRNKRQSSLINDSAPNSLHAREQDRLILDSGTYQIQLKDISKNFERSDKFRVILKSEKGQDSIQFYDAQNKGEIMIPGDHRLSFTVGDDSRISSRGPTRDGRLKPDYFIRNSRVEFSDGNISSGSSNAAAMYSAILLDYLAKYPYFTRDQLLNMQ